MGRICEIHWDIITKTIDFSSHSLQYASLSIIFYTFPTSGVALEAVTSSNLFSVEINVEYLNQTELNTREPAVYMQVLCVLARGDTS